MKAFAKRFNSRIAKYLIAKIKTFQVDTVRKWNPKIDQPTLSIYLGLLGINEAAPKECRAITLDFLLRADILFKNNDGSWILADECKSCRVYLFGDAKTIKNMTKFVRDMQNRNISYTQANVQAKVFLKALDCVVEAPGD